MAMVKRKTMLFTAIGLILAIAVIGVRTFLSPSVYEARWTYACALAHECGEDGILTNAVGEVIQPYDDYHRMGSYRAPEMVAESQIRLLRDEITEGKCFSDDESLVFGSLSYSAHGRPVHTVTLSVRTESRDLALKVMQDVKAIVENRVETDNKEYEKKIMFIFETSEAKKMREQGVGEEIIDKKTKEELQQAKSLRWILQTIRPPHVDELPRWRWLTIFASVCERGVE